MTGIKFALRQAQVDDLPLLCQWTMSLQQEETGPDDLPVLVDLGERLYPWLENYLRDPNALLLIAETEGRACGFGLGFLASQPNSFTPYLFHGVIQLIWIEPAQRRHGIAAQMVNAMEDVFREHGVPYIDIQHTAVNQLATNFWQNAHYNQVAVTRRKFLESPLPIAPPLPASEI